MGRHFWTILALMAFVAAHSQVPQAADSLETQKRLNAQVGVLSRYIWRGQAYGGQFVTTQSSVDYSVSKRWQVGFWGTTNFQKDYLESDGISSKGYHEIDLGVHYTIADFLAIEIWDYYWPTFERFDDVDQSYFNYGPDGVKTVDLSLVFDFSEYRYPFGATISTLVAGNDYKYDENGEDTKQNYTTYVEAGYTFENVLGALSKEALRGISVDILAGAVLNNRAEYYTAADYDKVSLVNLSVGASREFDLGNGFAMPFSIVYTRNAATRNTQIQGRDFAVAAISISY